jgi:death-on-curing protein
MKKIYFLTLAEVNEIHADQIKHYEGLAGIRDMNLLSSAVSMPHASFSGDFLHKDVFEMAAAYAFHICQNHPYSDGNKRTALASALVFLELNGISISGTQDKLYKAMINISSEKMKKEDFTEILRTLAE